MSPRRSESLSRLGHLSSDGFARPWLQTYSSLAHQARAAAAASGGASALGGGSRGGEPGTVFVEVQPVPRWRTLLKVPAGRMELQPASPGSGGFAAASSDLLRSLQALSVLDEEQEEEQAADATASASGVVGVSSSSSSTSSHSNSMASSRRSSRTVEGSSSAAAGSSRPPADHTPAAPLRFVPDPRRGTLRLLQATKEPEQLRLVWSPESAPAAQPAATSQASDNEPLDMFGDLAAVTGAASGSGSSRGAGGSNSARSTRSAHHSALLSFMPASAVAESAARGPLLCEGCELWEAAAEWEIELPLSFATPSSADSSADGSRSSSSSSTSDDGSQPPSPSSAPAAVEARRLPGGAQVLVVTPAQPQGRRVRRLQPAAAAFWLLATDLAPESLQPPAYATLRVHQGTKEAGEGTAGQPPVSTPAAEATGGEAAAAEETCASQPKGSAAEQLAAAMSSLLHRPPQVDLRRLRHDVKSGAIQVSRLWHYYSYGLGACNSYGA
jgi:hypothetical protein